MDLGTLLAPRPRPCIQAYSSPTAHPTITLPRPIHHIMPIPSRILLAVTIPVPHGDNMFLFRLMSLVWTPFHTAVLHATPCPRVRDTVPLGPEIVPFCTFPTSPREWRFGFSSFSFLLQLELGLGFAAEGRMDVPFIVPVVLVDTV